MEGQGSSSSSSSGSSSSSSSSSSISTKLVLVQIKARRTRRGQWSKIDTLYLLCSIEAEKVSNLNVLPDHLEPMCWTILTPYVGPL